MAGRRRVVTAIRVVHAITKGDVGGAQTHVVELAGAQTADGEDVTIVTGIDGPAMDRARARGIDVVIVPSLGSSRESIRQRRALADLLAALRNVGPDVVHGHSSNAGLLARIAAHREGWPSVYTAHGWPFQRGAAMQQRAKSWVGEFVGGRLGDAVIVLTEAEALRAVRARVVPRDRLWVIHNGIGDTDLTRPPSPSGSIPEIVMVARFAPPKLQTDLIRVMATLRDFPWMLTFVGDGPDLATTIATGTSLLGNRVRFLGHRDDVERILAASDVAVLWSRYEGMPIALLEAMRAGLCCVASDLPGVRALLGEPPAGFVAKDSAELTGAMRSLLNDRAAIEGFGAAARLRYESDFSASAMCAATREVYESVITNR